MKIFFLKKITYQPVRILCWESSFTVTSDRRTANTRQVYPFKGPTRILNDWPMENIALSSLLTVHENIVSKNEMG